MSITLSKINAVPAETLYDLYVGKVFIGTFSLSGKLDEVEAFLSHIHFDKGVSVQELFTDKQYRWDQVNKHLVPYGHKKTDGDLSGDLPEWLR